MSAIFDLPKIDTPVKVECRSCGAARDLFTEYRYFRAKPPMYMDFCTYCEQREGTITLYRRFNAYGTQEIIEAVFLAERTPEIKRTDEQIRLLVLPKAVRPPESNEEVVQREMGRRELARRRLIYYTTTFLPDYKPGWVHHDICRRLEKFVEDVEKGLSPRLMIAMPPRAGKSQLASDLFPSWVLGKHPEWGIIGASYAQSLPLGFSRNIRDRMRDPDHAAMFPDTKLRTDSQAIDEWKTTKGGGYIAAGVGVGINGKGMHIGIADDLLKDAEAASSETIRNSALAWYQSVFYTRLAPGGGILMIGTRWHDNDVQGAVLTKEQLLKTQGVPDSELDNWDVISYPAIAEADEYLLPTGEVWRGDLPVDVDPQQARLLRPKGEALHPERYPLNALMRIKHTMTSQGWSALYQQNPTPDDGDFFKRKDLRYQRVAYDYYRGCRIFMTADYAIKKKQKNDYTVLGVFALDMDDRLYLIDMVRGRWGTNEIADNVVAMIERHKPEVYAGEQGQIHSAVWPVIQQKLDAKRLSVTTDDTLVPVTEKEVRARPIQARTQTHRFIFAYDAPEPPADYAEAEKELLRFPNGTFDDCVDMIAWGGRLAMNISLPKRRVLPKEKSWKDSLGLGSGDNVSYMGA